MFKIKLITCDKKELEKIGFDSSYIEPALEKHRFFTIKIHNLNCAQANIIKQTALSSGTDCAVNREVITGKIELSNCILSGSESEIKKIAEKLKHQPFKLKTLANEIETLLDNRQNIILMPGKKLEFGKKTYIMGILNVTPDSFSDGGCYNSIEAAIEHYKEMTEDGADIIDIGGESTRPYSKTVSQEEEAERVIPVIKAIREFDKKTIISIDTRNAKTAKDAAEAGADIINDVSAMDWDENMLHFLKETHIPVILNHSRGTPDIMQENTEYSDVVDEIYDYLQEKINILVSAGYPRENIIIDPGIGFGKSTQQNFEIIRRIKEFKSLGCPILVGHSRKNFIRETLGTTNIQKLDIGTLLLSQSMKNSNVDILRVHNTKIHSDLNKLNELLV